MQCQARKGKGFDKCSHEASVCVDAINIGAHDQHVQLNLCKTHASVLDRGSLGVLVYKGEVEYHVKEPIIETLRRILRIYDRGLITTEEAAIEICKITKG